MTPMIKLEFESGRLMDVYVGTFVKDFIISSSSPPVRVPTITNRFVARVNGEPTYVDYHFVDINDIDNDLLQKTEPAHRPELAEKLLGMHDRLAGMSLGEVRFKPTQAFYDEIGRQVVKANQQVGGIHE